MLSAQEIVEYVHGRDRTAQRNRFNLNEAGKIGAALGIRWESFTVAQFLLGLNVELEHGTCNPATDVTHDDPILTGKLVLAHLNDFPDYYTRLAHMMLGSGQGNSMPWNGAA